MQTAIIKFCMFLLLMTGLTCVHAQDSSRNNRNPERIAKMQLQQVKQRITTLTLSQTDSLEQVFNVFGRSLSEVKNETQRMAKMQLLKKANQQKDKAVEKILNKEQLKIYEDIKQEWQEKMQQQQGRRRRN
jgi:hypothetical protein